ncbi:hypothetical protein QP185_07795 [Sphingomonas aerolata]|uniref:hypothetical protein n=1 Tax=Sphingomonas aerolata TaxID=185951 RepID=UPI002FDF2263
MQEPRGIRTWITSWFTAPPKVARPTAAEAEAAAITYVQDGVTATRLNSTYALHISFSDTDPAMAARIVNEFARQYTEGSLAKKQVENRDSTAMIARRAEDLRARWQAADAAEQRYRIQHNLTSTQGLSLTEQEISTSTKLSPRPAPRWPKTKPACRPRGRSFVPARAAMMSGKRWRSSVVGSGARTSPR